MKRLTLQSEIFRRAVEDIITRGDLEKLLQSKQKFRLKFGVDVTAASLHIGHTVNLWKMRELQDHGHTIVFLIGDFTTKIGDPTGRPEARRAIPKKDIDAWAKNFIVEVGKILRTDKKVFEVRRNSEWYGKMRAEDLINLAFLFTHARVIERDMFRDRISRGKEIFLPELLYPILQGYDSVMLKSNLTIVGTDQLFNENVGRYLQEKFGQHPQVVVTTTITPGLDGGAKMSKSLENYIGLSDSPRDKFGRAMRLLDSLVILYLEVYTDVPFAKVREIEAGLKAGRNPMEAKLFFAEALVRRYHGKELAQKEREFFLKVFSKKDFSQIPSVSLAYGNYPVVDLLLLLKLSTSKSEARRLVFQQAVEVDGRRVGQPTEKIIVSKGTIIRVGKKRFVRAR